MRIHCLILGFRIDREKVCNASGNHPLCRKCLSRQSEPADLSAGEKFYLIAPEEERPIQGHGLPAIKGTVRKGCECGRVFFPQSNRQRFCDRCGERNEAMKNRERQARFRKRVKTGLGVTV